MSKSRASRLRNLNRRPARPHLENLEDRVMLTAQVIEDFSSGNLSSYWTEYRYAPSAVIVPGATHDGTGYGLDKQDGFEWILRNDGAVQVQQGETLSVWTQFAGAVDGRIYFGFGSQPEGLVHSPLSDGHTLALVLAGNTGQLMFMGNDMTGSSGGFKPAPQTLGTPVSQTYNPDQWYRMEVVWGSDGSLTGNLYDSDGVTLLNTVTATETHITSGGIAFRGFGSDKYFDTVTVDPGNGGAAQYRNRSVNHHRLPSHTPPAAPPPDAGADTTGTPVPWDYTSVPGSNRDVALAAFDQLGQISGTSFVQVDGQTKVGLAAQNISEVEPDSNQILWGPNSYNGSGDVIPETPYLAQYIFRQLPGQPTYLIGSSDIKHFFSSARSDYQHLNPGEQDTYSAGLNQVQDYFLPGADLNPVTGEVHNFDDFGPVDANGFNRNVTRTYSSRLEYMLQVNEADLDPAQNPPGTRWYLMGNLWVAGDQDVSNNSRWVEITPSLSGQRFSFTYPNSSTGQFDFHTIPDLAEGPTVLGQTPPGNTTGTVSTVRLRFNVPIDEASFTLDQVSLQGPQGPIAVQAVTPVDGSNDELFDVTFAPQNTLGNYSLTVGPDITDQAGNVMVMAYSGRFTIQGPQVIASTPVAATTRPGPVSSVRLVFNEPMNPATFTPDQVDLFLGPNGRIPVTAVTSVAGSNNTAFDVSFAPQGTIGYYTMVVGPDIYDLDGLPMDQNNDFIPGQIPDDLYTIRFGIEGPRITTAADLGSFDTGVYTLRVAFSEPIDPSTFTPDKVASFQGPSGAVRVLGVSPVSGSNDMQFDLFFAPQNRAGTYQIVIGPNILDRFGNAMDQNVNLVAGEIPDDQFAGGFTILGPQITASTPSGTVIGPVDHVRVTFNQPIDVSTFTPDQVASFTDANGNPIPINSVQVVPGSGDKQFDINFDPQSTYGPYVMVIGPNVDDIYGNPMRAAYQATFSIQAPFYNSATATDYEGLEIYQNGGVPVRFVGNGTYYADDDYGIIDLGSDTFNFAGHVYTGANQLFVDSNGVITFGSAITSTDYVNTNLTTSPTQAVIAPLWSDWVKSSTDPGGEMILAKFEDTPDGGRRLIIEWNQIYHYNGNRHPVTFQVILTLNTGSAAGDIIFNYVDITTGDANSDGRTATIGVKDAGAQGARRLLVSFNAANSLVGSQQAILVTYAADSPGGSGSRDGLQVVAPADVSLAVGTSGPRLQPVERAGLIGHSRPAQPEMDPAALDWLFASPPDGQTPASDTIAGPMAWASAVEASDVLPEPLEGQRI